MDRRNFLKTAVGAGVAAVIPVEPLDAMVPIKTDVTRLCTVPFEPMAGVVLQYQKSGDELLRFTINYLNETVTAICLQGEKKGHIVTMSFAELEDSGDGWVWNPSKLSGLPYQNSNGNPSREMEPKPTVEG